MKPGKKDLVPGAPVYVPRSEVASAMSLGAVMVEGDARLHIPSPLPEAVEIEAYGRWVTPTAKIVWIGEFLEAVVGSPVDLTDIAGLIEAVGLASDEDERFVPLYVPQFEMDYARAIPGVHWDRRRRMYVADRSADFGLIYRYLTPAMKAVWVADRNLDSAMGALMRARAILAEPEEGDELSPPELSGFRAKSD